MACVCSVELFNMLICIAIFYQNQTVERDVERAINAVKENGGDMKECGGVTRELRRGFRDWGFYNNVAFGESECPDNGELGEVRADVEAMRDR